MMSLQVIGCHPKDGHSISVHQGITIQTAVCFAKKQKKLLTEKKHKHILKIVKGKGAVSEMMRRLFVSLKIINFCAKVSER